MSRALNPPPPPHTTLGLLRKSAEEKCGICHARGKGIACKSHPHVPVLLWKTLTWCFFRGLDLFYQAVE